MNANFVCSDKLFQIAAVTVLSQQMGAQLFFYFFINWMLEKNNNNCHHCQIITIQQQSRVIQSSSPEEMPSPLAKPLFLLDSKYIFI